MQMILKKYVVDENSNVYYKTRLMNEKCDLKKW